MIFTAFSDGGFNLAGRRTRCALGRYGVIAAPDKREGDGMSPIGLWPIRRVLYRPDRRPPPMTALSTQPLGPADGWCDDPGDPLYNQPVTHPYPSSAERLWRDDSIYDIIAVLGHNEDPPAPGAGSAIFLHLARENYAPTEGCVALAQDDLTALLALARPGDGLAIERA
jgi:L,D-peptidoglycan transpeptidase YkuD (ErfK/YbiS/YcfS/YnhG family)